MPRTTISASKPWCVASTHPTEAEHDPLRQRLFRRLQINVNRQRSASTDSGLGVAQRADVHQSVAVEVGDEQAGFIVQPVDQGVIYYLHDDYGPGRHAKIVSTSAKNILADGNKYHQEPPLTGDESVVAEVANVERAKLLDTVDDPTIITSVRKEQGKLIVTGNSHDNGTITSITVNDQAARRSPPTAGVVDWRIELSASDSVVAIDTRAVCCLAA